MRLIIEARLEGDQGSTTTEAAQVIAVVERQDKGIADLGLTLAEGRALLAEVQSVLVSHQTAGWMADQVTCRRCGAVLAHKDSRSIVMRTVFGKLEIASPRLWLPISSSIAESAVNQVVSHRMAKKQQMRWTDEGAHCLAQVRVAVLNGEFSVARLAELTKMPCANSSHARQAA
jgi:hypothetical protein